MSRLSVEPVDPVVPPRVDDAARRARIAAVVIGASAGGVEALGFLLGSLPADLRLPVVVVMHVLSGKPSRLAELFGSKCRVPVREASDKEPLVPGTIYIACPDYHLLVEPDFTLGLSNEEPVCWSRPSIDVLFESAAEAWGERLLGIVLTGANADGANGLRAVRAAGGLGWVQSPLEASSAVMPSAALKLAGADRVLELAEMAKELGLLAGAGSIDQSHRTKE
jgi:two-component system chemotaxis response regulator CheB